MCSNSTKEIAIVCKYRETVIIISILFVSIQRQMK